MYNNNNNNNNNNTVNSSVSNANSNLYNKCIIGLNQLRLVEFSGFLEKRRDPEIYHKHLFVHLNTSDLLGNSVANISPGGQTSNALAASSSAAPSSTTSSTTNTTSTNSNNTNTSNSSSNPDNLIDDFEVIKDNLIGQFY